MKPYACGESNIYIPDNDCSCGTAKAISTDPTDISFSVTGNDYHVPTVQDNLDALATELNLAEQRIATHYLFATVGEHTEFDTNHAVELPLAEVSSFGNTWTVDGDHLTCAVEGDYEVSASFGISTESDAIATITTSNMVVGAYALPQTFSQYSGVATIVVAPFIRHFGEGNTLYFTPSIMGMNSAVVSGEIWSGIEYGRVLVRRIA